MNLVGKIFVFMIFCMSLVFMSFAIVVYATHTSWYLEVNRSRENAKSGQPLGLKYQLEDKENELKEKSSQLSDLKNQLAAETATHLQSIGKLETEKAVLLAQEQQTKKAFSDVVATQQGTLAKVEAEQAKLNSLRVENDMLRTAIRDSHALIDKYFGAVVTTTEKIHAVTSTADREKERNQQLLEQVADAKTKLDKLPPNLKLPTKFDAIEADGFVTGVLKRGEDTFVQINIGSDDNIQNGLALEVFRGDKHIGQITIVRTEPDKAVGKVTGPLTAPVMARDHVLSRRSVMTSN